MVQFFLSLSFAYFFKSNLPIHITFTVLIMIQKKPILSKHFCQSPNLCSMHWQNTYRHGLWLHVPHVFWSNEFLIVCSYFSGFSQLPWGIFLYLELSMASRVPSYKRLKGTERTKGILLQKPPSTCGMTGSLSKKVQLKANLQRFCCIRASTNFARGAGH